MIKYEDYFPKSMLYKCGILPNSTLISDDELDYLQTNQNENQVNKLMNNIYTNIKNFAEEKHSAQELNNYHLYRKIVAMLCDLDVISIQDKEKHLQALQQKEGISQYAENNETRVSIELPELDAISINSQTEKSEKVIQDYEPKLNIKGKQKWVKYFALVKM